MEIEFAPEICFTNGNQNKKLWSCLGSIDSDNFKIIKIG